MVSTDKSLDALSPRVAAFLREFDAVAAGGATSPDGAERLADLFLSTFLNVSLAGASPVGTDLLVRSLPARERLFADAGVTGLTLESATETPLDDSHVTLRTTWRLVHPSATETTPRVESTFMLVDEGGALRIAAYINLTDLPALLRAVVD